MPVKIFFAAVEHNKRHELLNSLGVRYRLLSYFYLRKKSQARIDELLFDTYPKNAVIFIDSGAFTWMTSQEKAIRDNPAKFWDDIEGYLQGYIEFLKKYKGRIFCAAELDLDSLLEQDPVFDAAPKRYAADLEAWWNGEFADDNEKAHQAPPIVEWRKRLVETGVPINVVWHDQRKQRGWVDNTERHAYCGIPSEQAGSESRWFPFINTARKNGSLVHGFGMTKPQWIMKYPFYTVDSSSWISGERFGTTVLYQNGRLRHYTKDNKQVRKRYKMLFEKNGIDWGKLEKEEAWEVNQMNLLGWVLFSENVYRRPNRDYWQTELNGADKESLGPPREMPSTAASDAVDVLDTLEELPPGEDEAEWDALEPKKREKKPLGSNGAIVVRKEAEKNQLRLLVPDVHLDRNVRPIMFCNNCSVQDRCEFFEADASCHFKIENQFASPGDLGIALRTVAQKQYQRLLHAELVEKLDGGILDKNVSGEMDRMMNLFSVLQNTYTAPEPTLKIEAKGGGAITQMLSALMPPKKTKGEKLVQISSTRDKVLPEAHPTGPIIDVKQEDFEEA